MTGVLRRLSPWAPVESRRLLLLVAGGLGVVAVAWWFTSRESSWDSQTDSLTLAVVGAMVAAYGVTSWLLRARAVCAARRRAMFAVVPGFADLGDARDVPNKGCHPVSGEPASHVTAHPEQGRYHRPDCALADRDWPVAARAELADRLPCGVCQP